MKSQLPWRFFVIGFLVIIIVVFTVWFLFFRASRQTDENGLPTNSVSYEFVSSRPEARLYYPNAKVFSEFGQSEKRANFIVSPSGAYAGAVMISSDPPEKIYQWYKDWLLTHGWRSDKHAFSGLLSTQKSLEGYSRGNRETLYIAMNDPKQLGWTLGKEVPKDKTVFEISYFISIYKSQSR